MKLARAVFYEAALVLAAGVAFSLLSGCVPPGVEKRPIERVERPEVFETAERDFWDEDYDKALEGYARYLDQYPKGEQSRIALYRMATIRFRKGQFEKALDLFKQVDNEYPSHPDRPVVRHDIAQTYYRLGDYERSNEVATKPTYHYGRLQRPGWPADRRRHVLPRRLRRPGMAAPLDREDLSLKGLTPVLR